MSSLPTAGRFVGASVHRKEDKRLITGHGQYVDDVALPRMLHAAFLRSNLAKGNILSIDTSAARQVPGVIAVYTWKDFDGIYGPAWNTVMGEGFPLAPPLAVTDVRYVGDPVALVVAENRYIAADATELIEVELDPTDPCIDFVTAAENPNVVHAAWDITSNVMAETPFGSKQPDLEEAMAAAPHGIEVDIFQHRYVAVPMEGRGILAAWVPGRDEIDITYSCQKVHQSREFFARFLEIPEASVRIWARDVGGGFGQKAFTTREECAVALASRLLARPVKWIESRSENLIAAPHSRAEFGRVRIAIDDDLVVQAITIDHIADVGAYPVAPAVMMPDLLPGPYKIPRMGFSSKKVWTNTAGTGAYRGPWLFETTAREMAIDHAARVMGVDPIDLRRKNLLSLADLPFQSPGGLLFKEITPLETFEDALKILDYEAFRAEQAEARSQGRMLGLGCCVYVEPTAMASPSQGSESASIRIDSGGQVTVHLGSTAQGQSVETTMAQIVADTLGVDYSDVTVVQGQTESTPYGRGTGASGTAIFGGGAARGAAEAVRAKVMDIAAHALEADPSDMTIEAGRVFVKGSPSKSLTMKEVSSIATKFAFSLPADMSPGLEATFRFRPNTYPTWSNATHLCVMEIDRDTYLPQVLRYIVSEDCGAMINPVIVEGQIYGGVVQGVGGVLLEDFVYDPDGNPLTSTLADYLLATATEAPTIEIGHIETLSTTNPGGFKGMGEGGAIGSHAATANAVADALAPFGIHVNSTPLGPNNIHLLLESVGFTPGDVGGQ